MEAYFSNFVNDFKTEVEEITADYYKFDFNTSELPDVLEFTQKRDIRKHCTFEKMFSSLERIKTNCLYWFSTDTIEEATILKQIIERKKTELWNADKLICRILPARNKSVGSVAVYLGVRKGSQAKRQKITNISGRIVQHLGYYKEGRTQGLQLAYYAQEQNINLTLHLYSFRNCPDEYLYVLEKIFAKKLKPICGVH